MFNSYTGFKSATQALVEVIKRNPKIKVSQVRETLASHSPYGSTAAYKASFHNEIETAVASIEPKTDVNIQSVMETEFNRLAESCMMDIICWLKALPVDPNTPFNNVYAEEIDLNGKLFEQEQAYFALKPSKNNMGTLMYVLPEKWVQDARSRLPVNYSIEQILSHAFFLKMHQSFILLSDIATLRLKEEEQGETFGNFLALLTDVATNYCYQKDTPVSNLPRVKTNDLYRKFQLGDISESEIETLFYRDRDLCTRIVDHWDDTEGADWTDAEIINTIEEVFNVHLYIENSKYPVVKKFFNQQLYFYVTNYESEDAYRHQKGQVLNSDPYIFFKDAENDWKELISGKDFYCVSITSSSGDGDCVMYL